MTASSSSFNTSIDIDLSLDLDLGRRIRKNASRRHHGAHCAPEIGPVQGEQRLIHAAQHDDHESYRRLVEMHQDKVFRFCRHWLNGREEDAREACQDTFVRAYHALPGFRSRRNARFFTWLFRIALNLCRDRLRSASYRREQRPDSIHPSRASNSDGQGESFDLSPVPADAIWSSTLDATVVSGKAENLLGVAPSASKGQASAEELAQRPFLRTGELLEVVPGMIVTQHSGGGKANQYFVRGFNLDHGADFAIFVDSMPVNNRSHGHGQGYADINFLIPELVEQLDYVKGPYFP